MGSLETARFKREKAQLAVDASRLLQRLRAMDGSEATASLQEAISNLLPLLSQQTDRKNWKMENANVVQIDKPKQGISVKRGWGVTVFSNKKRSVPLESYLASSLKGAIIVAESVLSGREPPRNYMAL